MKSERFPHLRDYAEEHASVAIETIGEILHDSNVSAGTRLRAALAILRNVVQPEKLHNLHNPAQWPALDPNQPCPCGVGPEHRLWCLYIPAHKTRHALASRA